MRDKKKNKRGTLSQPATYRPVHFIYVNGIQCAPDLDFTAS